MHIAHSNDINVAKTLTNFVRLKDQSAILENNKLVSDMIKGSIFSR